MLGLLPVPGGLVVLDALAVRRGRGVAGVVAVSGVVAVAGTVVAAADAVDVTARAA
jgi:hypothetical protein